MLNPSVAVATRRIVYIIVVVLSITCAGCKKAAVTPAGPQPEVGTVWVSAADTGYINFALNLNIRLSAIFECTGTQTAEITNWINFIKLAQQRGVKLRICPIPVSGAAYLDARHAAAQLAIVSNFVQLMQSSGIKPGELILDVEGNNPSKYCQALVQFALGSVAARDTLVANALTQAGHDSAVAFYQAFVNQSHAAGWKVGATTLNQIAVEQTGGDNNIERVLSIPITGVSWDFVTYQAYRTSTYSIFASLGFPAPTALFVYRFALMAKTHYGALGGVDIGIMGISNPNGCYNNLGEWQSDVDATRAAGINPDLVAGFDMESANGNNPLPGDSTYWFSQLESSPVPAVPADDQATDDYINIYFTADTSLVHYLP